MNFTYQKQLKIKANKMRADEFISLSLEKIPDVINDAGLDFKTIHVYNDTLDYVICDILLTNRKKIKVTFKTHGDYNENKLGLFLTIVEEKLF